MSEDSLKGAVSQAFNTQCMADAMLVMLQAAVTVSKKVQVDLCQMKIGDVTIYSEQTSYFDLPLAMKGSGET